MSSRAMRVSCRQITGELLSSTQFCVASRTYSLEICNQINNVIKGIIELKYGIIMWKPRKRFLVLGRPFDRFIPYRPLLNVEESNYRLRTNDFMTEEKEGEQYKDPNPTIMSKMLNGGKLPIDGRVLPIILSSGGETQKSRRNRFLRPTNTNQCFSGTRQGRRRRIPRSPECVMDMPGLRDDFYTSLLDWGHKNFIAVALDQSTYVWHAESKECQRIDIIPPEVQNSHVDFFITALCWKPQHQVLAIADTEGDVTICDVEAMKTQEKIARMGKTCSVGALLWTENNIISGNRRGHITVHDQREPEGKNITRLSGHHGREVCGLTYRSSLLASGGDDGLVNIWDLRMNEKYKSISAHTACAKALAWCPWRPGIIASGGGSSDGFIRLWNVNNGEKIGETFTKSQVCSVLWSQDYSELVSSHGSSVPEKNDIVVWDMKNLQFDPLAILRQHVARPLHLAMSPDGTTVASAGADEALCLWKLFPKKVNRERTVWDSSPLNLIRTIR